MKYVLFPEDVGEGDLNRIRGKGFNLAKMLKAGFPVPECFFVSADAYYEFLEKTGLKNKILERISRIDFSSVSSLTQASQEIKAWIVQESVPEEIKNEIEAIKQEISDLRKDLSLGGILLKKRIM